MGWCVFIYEYLMFIDFEFLLMVYFVFFFEDKLLCNERFVFFIFKLVLDFMI